MNMIRKSEDGTLARNNVKLMLRLIDEYEAIKAKKHPRFRFVEDFYKSHNIKRQNFIKYYNRYKNSRQENDLLPRKRGPKYKAKRPIGFIEEKVLKLRKQGLSRYEIFDVLKEKLKKFTPCPSTVYNICKRNNLNKLKPKMKQNKRKIIKEKAGELGHVDCHYLPKGLIENDTKRYYLAAIMDDCTRLVWAEVVEDIKSLTVMFALLKSLNMLKSRYNIQFAEVLSDNGSEFGSGRHAKNKQTNPFERMLLELGIKHRYTQPYRPQTNGKIERFWRTLNEDLIEDTTFDSLEHLRDELQQYLLYFNELRPHQGIGSKIPADFNKNCHRIS